METSVSRILSKIFHRSRALVAPQERTVDEMLEEVQRSTRQLKWLVKRWAMGNLSHDRFQECVDLEQSLYNGISPQVWTDDPVLARTALAERDDAMRYVLAVTEAIEHLREMGYKRDAIPEAKRRHLAKVCQLRLPKGWKEAAVELEIPSRAQ